MQLTETQIRVLVPVVCALVGLAVWIRLDVADYHRQQHAEILPHTHLADGRACWYEPQGPEPEAHVPRVVICSNEVVK